MQKKSNIYAICEEELTQAFNQHGKK